MRNCELIVVVNLALYLNSRIGKGFYVLHWSEESVFLLTFDGGLGNEERAREDGGKAYKYHS
jgi:hypothetical protein